MVNLNLIHNLIFLSILSLTFQTSAKIKFLSFTADINTNNNLLQIQTNQEEKMFDLISEYRTKLLKNTIFAELIKKVTSAEKIFNKKENKIIQKDFFKAILIEKQTEENIETYFNTTEYIWESMLTLGEAPNPRRGHSMVLADTYLIVFGGSDLDSKFCNELYFFDLLKKTWMKVNGLGNIPSPRADHSAVLHGTTMWIFGGASSLGYLNDLYSFNIENVNIFL